MALRLFRKLSLPTNVARAWASQSSSSQSNQSAKTTTGGSPPASPSSAGRYISIILLTVGIYAGYKMISNRSSDLRKDEHYKRATADYQKANAQGTDVKG